MAVGKLARLRPYAPALALAAVAAVVTWAFAATVLAHTRPMGLPLDDSYIYLTYAKQFGRAQPFTYFPGGGYSAGSTSVLWPMLIAPFWTLGARGHALVWVSFLLGAAMYTAVALGCYRFVRALGGEVAGMATGLVVLAIAPFAWCSLSGMEVGFAAALLVATLLLLARTPRDGAPSRLLAVCMSAASLSRPEAMLVVGGVCGISCVLRLRARDVRSAAWWLAPLAAPIVWLVANRVLAGNFFPNTGVAKSHFYLPGFDWAYWRDAVTTLSGRMLRGLYWDDGSPLGWPRLVAALQVAGSVRLLMWAKRERRHLAGGAAVAAPIVMLFAVIASSGLWNFQNFRYVAPALPLIALVAGCALAPPRWLGGDAVGHRLAWPVALGAIAGLRLVAAVTGTHGWFVFAMIAILLVAVGEWGPPRRLLDAVRPAAAWVRRGWLAGVAVVAVLYANGARPRLVADMKLFAQGAMDTNTQVVAIGEYLHAKLPDASVMFHDAGAIAYYGDGRVYDMLGLVTNYQAGIANNGPGARFEFLESLPPERRPTHFAYYPGWMGTAEFFGDVLLHTSLRPGFEPRRLVGEGDMQVLAASWDHIGTGERPLNDHTGWTVVDRVDIADIASEREHHWVGRMGRRHFGDPTARWSMVERETTNGLVIDGGRTIRDGGERFTVSVDPAKPTRVVIRTGGQRSYPWHEGISGPVTLTLFSGSRQLAQLVIGAPDGNFSELTFNVIPHALPGRESELRVEASGVYRVFHWFVLQPE